jgi:hypothetical protein
MDWTSACVGGSLMGSGSGGEGGGTLGGAGDGGVEFGFGHFAGWAVGAVGGCRR